MPLFFFPTPPPSLLNSFNVPRILHRRILWVTNLPTLISSFLLHRHFVICIRSAFVKLELRFILHRQCFHSAWWINFLPQVSFISYLHSLSYLISFIFSFLFLFYFLFIFFQTSIYHSSFSRFHTTTVPASNFNKVTAKDFLQREVLSVSFSARY